MARWFVDWKVMWETALGLFPSIVTRALSGMLASSAMRRKE